MQLVNYRGQNNLCAVRHAKCEVLVLVNAALHSTANIPYNKFKQRQYLYFESITSNCHSFNLEKYAT